MTLRHLYLLVTGLMLLLGHQARAEDMTLTVGVTSFRPRQQAEMQWQPLADYLNKSVKGVRFEIHAYDYTELAEAVRQQTVDLVITQPSEYVRMVHQNGLSSPLATIINLEQSKPLYAMGGTMLALDTRTDLETLKDLQGKRIATAAKNSFGSYLAQYFELSQQGVKPSSVIETGLPQDRVIELLFAGQADAAFVRTGLLEALQREGKLKPGQLKVVNQQNYAGYPLALSTRLYPEWPVIAMPHVPAETMVRIAGALLSLPHGSALAHSMGIHGFAIPADYEPVRSLMRELRVSPFDQAPRVSLHDIWAEYRAVILALCLTLLALLALAMRERIMRRQLSAISNAMGEGLYVLDHHGRVTFINKAACRMLGYAPQALIGREILPLIVSPSSAQAFTNPIGLLSQTGHGVQAFEGESIFVTAEGKNFPVEVSTQPVLRHGKVQRSVTVFDDISERKAQNERVYQLAFHDPITGLPNRRLLLDKLSLLLGTRTNLRRPGALLLSDLDRFKQLNDTLGHKRGDALLQAVARRLSHVLGDRGLVARPGGDEFAVVLDGLASEPEVAAQQVHDVAEKIHTLMREPFEIESQRHQISTSIGIVMFEGHEESPEELLKCADIALYQAKESGRNTFRFFDKFTELALGKQVALEADLHQALQQNQFEVHYQPKVNAQGQIVGAEALLRWQHPQRGMVSPAEFIPLAEQAGLIVPIGHWVLEQACRQVNQWGKHPATAHLVVSVNLCALQIFQPDFVPAVTQTLRHCGTDPTRIQLELTESVLARNIEDVIDKMRQLVAIGLSFALDDFGTGYSSLNYLKRLPLQQLKIDASFVRDLMTDPNDASITRAIIALGHSLDLEVIAEGVEQEAQKNILVQQGCHLFQGYLFGKPQPAANLVELILDTHIHEDSP